MSGYFKVYLDNHQITGVKRAHGPADGLSKAQKRALDLLFASFNISGVALSFEGTNTAVLYGRLNEENAPSRS